MFKSEKINFIFDDGGLGDNIARMVTMRYIKDHFPHVTPYLYVPDYFLPVARNLVPDLIIRPFSKGHKLFDEKLPGRHTNLRHHDTLATHLVDHTFHALSNRQVDIKFKNYLKLDTKFIHIEKFKLPEKYVVMTTGFTAPIREFKPEKVNSIVQYLNDKGMAVVFLGSHQAKVGATVEDIKGNFADTIDYSKGIDLINKTSLLEAGKIIAQSQAIVGVDNGLMHLAACSDVPIIGGYTSVDPVHRLPYRHDEKGWNCYTVVPPESEPEKFCQSRWDFVYNHDFRFSYFKNDDLINSLKAEDFIAHLETILK